MLGGGYGQQDIKRKKKKKNSKPKHPTATSEELEAKVG